MVTFEAAVALATLLFSGATAADPPPFVPGEVLVRFRPDTRARTASGEAAPQPEVEAFLKGVSCEVERPLRFLRAASGGDVVVGLDVAELRDRLERKLTGLPEVGSVTPRARGEGQPPTALEVRVRAPATAADLGKRAAAALDLPIVDTASGGSQASVVELDLRALTLDLVERLKRRPDVEYAQLNFSVRKIVPNTRRPL
jgi:hypothetical protein